MTTEKYGDLLFSREIKIEELDKYLTKVKNNRVRSRSGGGGDVCASVVTPTYPYISLYIAPFPYASARETPPKA